MKNILVPTLMLASSAFASSLEYQTTASPSVNFIVHKDPAIYVSMILPGVHVEADTPSGMRFNFDVYYGPNKKVDVFYLSTALSYKTSVGSLLEITPFLAWKTFYAKAVMHELYEDWAIPTFNEYCRRIGSISPSVNFHFNIKPYFNIAIQPIWASQIVSNYYFKNEMHFKGFFPEHQHSYGGKVSLLGNINESFTYSLAHEYTRSLNGNTEEHLSSFKIGYSY